MFKPLVRPLGFTAIVVLASCASDGASEPGDEGCAGGKCDDADGEQEFACRVADESGRGSSNDDILSTLADPIAKLVLQTSEGGCPRTFDEIMDKLRAVDDENCSGFGESPDELEKQAAELEAKAEANPDQPDLVAELKAEAAKLREQAESVRRRQGIRGRIVTERAQLTGGLEAPAAGRAPTRAVITRECNNRNTFELIFSLLGVTDKSIPQNNTEMIGFDPVEGVFNFYTLRGGEWSFHGNSQDFVTPGNEAECRACHTGGGLIMKELNAPWVHWEGDTVTPGVDTLFAAHENLGARSDGIDMEGAIVVSGNDRWNDTRIAAAADPKNEALHDGSMQTLLRPLFCDSEFNLQSAGVGAVSFVPGDLLAHPLLGAGGVSIDAVEYQRALVEIESRIEARDGTIVQRQPDPNVKEDEAGPARDTFFGLTFPEPAQSDIDYIGKLQNAKLPEGMSDGRIADFELVADVLAIDFTRAAFSDERCGLLEFVPTFEEIAAVDLSSEPPPPEQPDPHVCCAAKPAPPQEGEFDRTAHIGCAADLDVEMKVCAADSFCCGEGGNGFWDDTCAREVESVAGQFCGFAQPEEESETTKRIRLAMIEKLKKSTGRGQLGSAAAKLLSNLQEANQASQHSAAVNAFNQACNARASSEDAEVRMAFIKDVLTVAARLRRDAARFSPVLEFQETMVTDALDPSAGAHLDATTCELVE